MFWHYFAEKTASCCMFSVDFTYICNVVATFLCPSLCYTAFGLTPPSINIVACAFLKEWKSNLIFNFSWILLLLDIINVCRFCLIFILLDFLQEIYSNLSRNICCVFEINRRHGSLSLNRLANLPLFTLRLYFGFSVSPKFFVTCIFRFLFVSRKEIQAISPLGLCCRYFQFIAAWL